MKFLKMSLALICFSQLKAQDTAINRIFLNVANTHFDMVTRIQQTRVTLENGDVRCGYFNPSDSFFYDCNKAPQFRIGDKHYFSSGAGCCTSAQGGYTMTFAYSNLAIARLPQKDVEGTIAEIKTDDKTKTTTILISDKSAVFELKFDEATYKRVVSERAAIGEKYAFRIM